MRRTLVLLTPVSYADCVADFRGDVVNLSKTIAEEAGLIDVRGLPGLPLCTSQMLQCVSNLSQSRVIVKRIGGCLKLTLPLTLNFSDLFKLVIPL
jgi:hypothetical protein